MTTTSISLKKALKLRKELEALTRSPTLPTSIQILISPTQDPDIAGVRLHAFSALSNSITQQTTLSSILADIRSKLSASNAKHGVDDILAEIGHLDRMIALHKDLPTTPLTPEDEIKTKIDLIRRRSTDSYADPILKLTVPYQDAAHIVADLKRQKEALEDKRTAINAVTTIELTDDQAATLQGLGLI